MSLIFPMCFLGTQPTFFDMAIVYMYAIVNFPPHDEKSVCKLRKILPEYPKIFFSKVLRGINFRTRVAAVITMRVLKFRNPFSEYPNVVAVESNLGPEGPLTKIFSDIPTIFLLNSRTLFSAL